MAKEENLVTISKFAEMIGTSPQYVSQLCKEPKIKVKIIGEVKFIDTSVYDPEDFKPKPKKEKT